MFYELTFRLDGARRITVYRIHRGAQRHATYLRQQDRVTEVRLRRRAGSFLRRTGLR